MELGKFPRPKPMEIELSSVYLASCIGVVVVTIAVTWFYKLGGSLNRFFWIVSVIVGSFFLWKLMTRGRSVLSRIAGNRLEFLVMLGFAACIILPP